MAEVENREVEAPPALASRPLLTHRLAGKEGTRPLLLLNGGMMSLSAWDEVAAPIEAERRVLRCDFRGQLLSPGVPEPRLDAHVEDVVALLDALSLDEVDVMGTSYGGMVAMRLAASRPERVTSLIVVTATDLFDDEMTDGLKRLRAACTSDHAAVYDLIVETSFSPAWAAAHAADLAKRRAVIAILPDYWFVGLAGLLDAIDGLDLRPSLPAIACPTLVVSAADDAVMPRVRTDALAAAIPCAESVIVPDSGHALVLERPDALRTVAAAFLSRTASRPR